MQIPNLARGEDEREKVIESWGGGGGGDIQILEEKDRD